MQASKSNGVEAEEKTMSARGSRVSCPLMMILAQTDDSTVWMRIILPIVPWIALFALVWFAAWLQSRSMAKLFLRRTESLEAKIDALIKAAQHGSSNK